jgi:hypothetical protein
MVDREGRGAAISVGAIQSLRCIAVDPDRSQKNRSSGETVVGIRPGTAFLRGVS